MDITDHWERIQKRWLRLQSLKNKGPTRTGQSARIVRTSGEKVTETDLALIAKGGCIHCGKKEDNDMKIGFMYLGTGQLIWWHCTNSGICNLKKYDNKLTKSTLQAKLRKTQRRVSSP